MSRPGDAIANPGVLRQAWASALLLLMVAGAGCLQSPAPVSDRSLGRGGVARVHVVAPGDTLYSIAWDAGRDYRRIAAWNGIRAPYIIKPGQRLRLDPPARSGRAAAGGYYTVRKGDTLYSIARARDVSYRQLAAWNGIRPPYTIRPGQRLSLHGRGAAAASSAPRQRTGKTASRAAPRTVRDWQWPVHGRVIAGFTGSGGNKGIDIAGSRGQTIAAASGGRVVYQGGGLRGYGKLIIVKHNSDYLSAYAHCDSIYVKEGDVIKRGQTLGTMGSTGTDRVKLHFEIRYRGNPVNPLNHLPKT